uniref:Uncharacterized protein n=1 Tax=viral metagenome TaxID=1070528 RepID=A0A6C0EYX9_9ZZZZ
MTVGMMNSAPSNVFTPTMDVATAAVDPEMRVGHPPIIEVINEIIIVLWIPVMGGSPRMDANAIDSGIKSRAIVRPEKNSLITWVGFIDDDKFVSKFIFYTGQCIIYYNY